MNSIRSIVIIWLCSLVLQSAIAQNGELTKMKHISAFKAELEQMAEQTNTIEAAFRQEKYLSILSNNIESEGRIFFKKPNLLKWSYQEPYQYTIVLDGREIKIKDEEKVNAFDIESSKIFKEVNDLILNSVNGRILDEEKFNIEYFYQADNYVTYLTPKDPKLEKYISKIEVYFDKEDLTVNCIILHESNSDYTKINFTNKILNGNIPDKEFSIN